MAAGGKKNGAQTFADSAPQMATGKPKFRPQPEEEYGAYPANIMFDKRVIRGNTYAAQILPAALPAEDSGKTLKKSGQLRFKAPDEVEPVEGRRHMDVQTDAYLEELTDTVPEAEVTTQTDAFMDRPPTPLFIPMKVGVDFETQIYPGDLFDFDFEVEPILEVLVGKTLEQGLMEVMEEEELAAMRAHQEHFEQIRNAELVATQRMEAGEKRKMEEKERRLAQERERVEREKAVREKVAAQTFARGYLSGLVGNVFDKLYDAGFFYDPVQKEVETEFMPWMTDLVVAECSKAAAARKVVNDLIVKAIKDNLAAKAAGTASAKKSRADAAAADAAEVDAAAAAKAALEEKANTELAKEVLEGLAPPLELTPEQVEEQRQALIPPPPEPEEVAEGEEPPPPPTDVEVLTKVLDEGVVSEEAVAKAFVAKQTAPPAEAPAE